jgi:hypothetical protein
MVFVAKWWAARPGTPGWVLEDPNTFDPPIIATPPLLAYPIGHLVR